MVGDTRKDLQENTVISLLVLDHQQRENSDLLFGLFVYLFVVHEWASKSGRSLRANRTATPRAREVRTLTALIHTRAGPLPDNVEEDSGGPVVIGQPVGHLPRPSPPLPLPRDIPAHTTTI